MEKPIKVLIVDDEPVLRELVAFILVDKGFQFSEADSGNTAFQMISCQKFDVVVSDIRMPDGNGVELLKKINRMREAKPAVFLVSGYSEISPEEARKLGAKDLLNKPVDYDSLCSAIYHCSRSEMAFSSSFEVSDPL